MTEHGVFAKPYSFNQCPTVGCPYELPVDASNISEWPELVKAHVLEAHKDNSIWTKLVK